MTTTKAGHDAAVEAKEALSAALKAAGITLPSVTVDVATGYNGVVLVSLGRVRPDVVQRLAAVILKGAGE